MSVNFLFWNTRENALIDALDSIVRLESIDIVILAEYREKYLHGSHSRPNMYDLVNHLNGTRAPGTSPYQIAEEIHLDGPLVLSRLGSDLAAVNLIQRSGIYLLRHCGEVFLVAALHLPSMVGRSEEKHATEVREHLDVLLLELKRAEEKFATNKHLLIGDFNLNPFDVELTSRDRLNSFPTRRLARVRKRKDPSAQKKWLVAPGRYNPSWSLFGDAKSPPGTYYFRDSGYEWHVFDQVLLSNDAALYFDRKSLRAIYKTGPFRLIKSGVPDKKNYSDHLPISFSLKTL